MLVSGRVHGKFEGFQHSSALFGLLTSKDSGIDKPTKKQTLLEGDSEMLELDSLYTYIYIEI